MSSGKRFKFQKSQIQLGTEFASDSPGLSVTGVTKADPPVVTLSSTTTLGDTNEIIVGRFEDVSGMTEIDGETYIAQIIDGTTIKLLNQDSSGYAAFTGTAIWRALELSDWCEVTGLNRQGGSSPEVPASSVCSDFEEIEVGLPSFGTAQIDFHYAPMTNLQQAMEEFQSSGEKVAIRYSLPRSGGQRTVLGFIQQTGEQGQVNGLWTGSMTFRATGKPVTVIPA